MPETTKNEAIHIKQILEKFIDVPVDIEKSFRIGVESKKPRMFKVVLKDQKQVSSIVSVCTYMNMENRKRILGTSIFIDRDLTKLQIEEKRAALLIKRLLEKDGKTAVIRDVNGTYQCVERKIRQNIRQ